MPELCERCVHKLICEWCAQHTDFTMPQDDGRCDLRNTDFDDLEEAVSVSIKEAKECWEDAREDTYDPTKAAFWKGRMSALKDVFAVMAHMGHTGGE